MMKLRGRFVELLTGKKDYTEGMTMGIHVQMTQLILPRFRHTWAQRRSLRLSERDWSHECPLSEV